ncbi:MAG: hypothetical protein ACREIV_11535 [Planctomycetaceae bacterium]
MQTIPGAGLALKRAGALSAAAAVSLLPLAAAAQSQSIVFRERFSSGAPGYAFAHTFPLAGMYTLSHDANGGPDGSGAAHLRMLAGRDQYNLGWVAGTSGRSFGVGDAVYIRFRIRFDDDHLWLGGGSLQNKFILLGESRAATQSRIIVHNEKPHPTSGCALGYDRYDGSGPRWLPRDFGLNYSSWEDPAISGKYSSLSVKVNIGLDCTPPVLLTRGEWYDVQIYAKSSSNRTGEFKVWVNNNDFASPDSQVRGFNLGTHGWSSGMTVGGFMSEAPARDGGFLVDDVELATTFDPDWASGDAVSRPRPSPPGDVRLE